MNLHISSLRIGLTLILLALLCLGASPPTGLSPLRDDPPTARDAIDAGLRKRRETFLKLEESVQSLRDEVKLQLTDFVAGQQAVVLKIQKEYNDAKVTRGQAEFAVKAYLQGDYLMEQASVKGKIALAKSDHERARDDREAIRRRREQRLPVDPNEVIRADLTLQQAEFDEEQTELELKVLNDYTKDKEMKKRQAAVAAAEAVEAEKEGLLKLERAKAAKLAEQAERLKVRSPEDLVLALLNGAIEDEGKVVALVTDSQKIESRIREKPGDAPTLIEQLRAKKVEAEASMNQAKARLLEAASLAEQVKLLRAKLRDAEAHLRQKREMLDVLERGFAPKP